MSEVCPKCGLPKELCVCQTIASGEQRIVISKEKRKFGKITTVVKGFDTKNINIKDVAKKLKSKLACGGTTKESEGVIELQGNHMDKVKKYLVELGFPASTITIK